MSRIENTNNNLFAEELQSRKDRSHLDSIEKYKAISENNWVTPHQPESEREANTFEATNPKIPMNLISQSKEKDLQSYIDKLNNLYLRVDFQFLVFFKFFAYHIIFFTLGPLGGCIISLWEGYTLIRNMAFLGTDFICLLQYCHYFLLLTGMLLYALEGGVQSTDLISAILMTIIRILIIASRYAYTPPRILDSYKSKKWVLNKRFREYILEGWIYMTNYHIDTEIMTAIVKAQIEYTTFNFTFMHKLSSKWEEKLSEECWLNKVKASETTPNYIKKKTRFTILVEELIFRSKFNEEDLPKKSEEEDNIYEKEYSGRALASTLLELSNGVVTPFYYLVIILIISLLSSLIPFISRCFFDDSVETCFGDSYGTYQIVYTVSMILLNLLAKGVTLMFLAIGLIDFKRRWFLSKLLIGIVDKNRTNNQNLFRGKTKTIEDIPFLNIFSPNTIMAWLSLKLLLRSLGAKYLKRVIVYVEIFFSIYAVAFIFLCLVELEIIKSVEISITTYLLLCYQLFCVLTIIFMYIWTGAKLNNQSELDCYFWSKHKVVLHNLSENSNKLSSEDYRRIIDNNLREGVKQCKIGRLGKEEIREMGDGCAGACDILIERVRAENEINPYRLFGHVISDGFKDSIYAFTISLLFATATRYFNL